jgi:hypothetical protein
LFLTVLEAGNPVSSIISEFLERANRAGENPIGGELRVS